MIFLISLSIVLGCLGLEVQRPVEPAQCDVQLEDCLNEGV